MRAVGVRAGAAYTLARAHTTDLHAIIKAKEQGCPDQVLLKIFGPDS